MVKGSVGLGGILLAAGEERIPHLPWPVWVKGIVAAAFFLTYIILIFRDKPDPKGKWAFITGALLSTITGFALSMG